MIAKAVLIDYSEFVKLVYSVVIFALVTVSDLKITICFALRFPTTTATGITQLVYPKAKLLVHYTATMSFTHSTDTLNSVTSLDIKIAIRDVPRFATAKI